jgi:diaminopimelate decarboxylase
MNQKNKILPSSFSYFNDQLTCNGKLLSDIVNVYGTPLFLYSEQAILESIHSIQNSIKNYPVTVCYAVKANPALSLIKLISNSNFGFDVVSSGELKRILKATSNSPKIVFSGVGKTKEELDLALSSRVHCINVESISELYVLNERANYLNLQAPISIRINPDIDAKTHPYISTGLKNNKFGLSIELGFEAYKIAKNLKNIKVIGVDCHIGSQIIEMSPFIQATEKVLEFVSKLANIGIKINHLNLGGGLGVCYKNEVPPTTNEFFLTILDKVKLWSDQKNIQMPSVIFELGRSIIANAGILICKVNYLKESKNNASKNFAVVDAAMNDLMRPSLYNAYHEIIPLNLKTENTDIKKWDIVGPICETGDWLAKNRTLHLYENCLLAFASAGAYCSSMSSNYNSRLRSSEVLVRQNGDVKQIIKRENFDCLIKNEILI